MLDIVIVDDEYDFLMEIYNRITATNRFRIKGIFNDVKSASTYLNKSKPDIVIIDIKKDNQSGIKLLKKIRKSDEVTKTMIISSDKESVVDMVNSNLYADEILIRPFKLDMLIDRLDALSKSVPKHVNSSDYKIENILDNFYFSKTNRGYYYITECIDYCINMNCRHICGIKELYKEVASKIKVDNSDLIEWNISKSIKIMNKYTKTETLEKFFPYNQYPSPKIFLNEVLDRYYKDNNEEKY